MCCKNTVLSYINVHFTSMKTTAITNTNEAVQELEIYGDLWVSVSSGKNVFGYGLKRKTNWCPR